MDLLIEAMRLFDEVTDIKSAREAELSVSVYVDDTAPSELVAHVRGTFASTGANVRMTLSYLDANFVPQPDDDIAVVVAGTSEKVGSAGAALRAVGVPVMVVALSPAEVAARAEKMGYAIPDGDLISPYEDWETAGEQAFDDAAIAHLDELMGNWIVAVCREKRLAFAIAFPFMRRPLASDSVQATSFQNAGVGLVPLIPGADLPIMTLNQAKMVLQIAAAYGREMDKDRIKELVAVVGSAYLFRTLARELVEFVPVLGFLVRAGVAYGGTSALGYALIEYFEGGENAGGVANVASAAAGGGTKLVSRIREGISDPSSLGIARKAGDLVPVIRGKVDEIAPAIREKAGEYVPKIADTVADIMTKAVATK